MNTKNVLPNPTSPWRARFLEIAREAQAEVRRAPALPSGLRARSKMAGFATLRLGRRAATGARVA